MANAPHTHVDVPSVVRVADPLPDGAPAFTGLVDLASELLGSRAIASSDEFFAPVSNLVRASTPVFVEDLYTDHGKWMDGWESRRRRTPGHDWAVVRLGAPGCIAGVDVDTAHFLGNNAESAVVEVAWAPDASDEDFTDGGAAAGVEWTTIVERAPTAPGCHNLFQASPGDAPATHVRLQMHPDGGIARLRCWGTVTRTFEEEVAAGTVLEMSCATTGGRALCASDEFFCDRGNLLLPGPARTMGEGWETRRRRGGRECDWVVVALAAPTRLERLVVDTSHYKGNYPDACSIEAIDWRGREEGELTARLGDDGPEAAWQELLPHTKLRADDQHHYGPGDLEDPGAVTHLRLRIFPDGGIARLRAYGAPVA